MTPTQAVKFVATIGQIWPSMKIDEYTPDAWYLVLDDLDIDDAMAAVKHLARTKPGYISPADIRRQVAATAGLIPSTTEAEGLAAAATVAGNRGEGASKLDPITRAAYRAMGGATAFDEKPSIIRPQWGRVWADAERQHHDRVLGGNLAAQITEHHALTGAPRIASAAIEAAPVVTDRSEETKQLLANLAKTLPASSPAKLHSRESTWKRMQRALNRKAEPNPHYRPEIAAAAAAIALDAARQELAGSA